MDLIRNFKIDLYKNSIFQNIIFFSLIFMPVALVAGPAVMETLIFVSCFSFLSLITIKEIKFHIDKKIIFILSLYLIIIVISSLISINPIVSLKSGVLSLRFFIFVLAGVFLLSNFEPGCKYLFYTYTCFIMFIAVDAFVQYFYGYNFFLIEPIDETRITGFFGNEKKLGSYLVRFFPILIGLSLIFIKNKNFLILLVPALILFFLLFLTRERITLVFFLITIIYLTVYFWNEILKNMKVFILFTVILISIPVLMHYFDVAGIKKRLVHTKKQITNDHEGLVFYSMQHQSFAKTSFEIFKSNKLFGSGIKSYRETCKQVKLSFKKNCSTHPHNVFFQLLAETGLLGILFYLTFLFLVIKELVLFFFCKNKRTPNVFFLLSFFFYFNPLFPSGQFFNNWYMGIGTFPLIFYFYFKLKKII